MNVCQENDIERHGQLTIFPYKLHGISPIYPNFIRRTEFWK